MIPVFIAAAGLAVGLAVGSASAKNQMLKRPVYIAMLAHKDGTNTYIEGTLLQSWTDAMQAANDSTGKANAIMKMSLVAPGNVVIKTWSRP